MGGDLYHEPLGEPVRGRNKLIERLRDYDNYYLYVNPKDGSEVFSTSEKASTVSKRFL